MLSLKGNGIVKTRDRKMRPTEVLSNPSSPCTRQPEKQIAPGIYFTPSASHNQAPRVPENVHEMSLGQLRSERDALKSSIKMLIDSNEQMLAIDPGRCDPVLTEAIGENVPIILRRRERLTVIERCLAHLVGETCDTSTHEEEFNKSTSPTTTQVLPTAGDTSEGMFL